MAVESVTPNFVEGCISAKEKIDIEMGNRLGEESGYSLPEILRNLDYDDLEDDELKIKEEGGRRPIDPCFPEAQDLKKVENSFPRDEIARTEQSSYAENGDREFMQRYNAGNETDTMAENEDCRNSHPTTASSLQV